MRERVRFADGVKELLGESGRVVVEVGPCNALAQLVRAQGHKVEVISLLAARGVESETAAVLRGVAKLWLEGVGVKWEELWRGERRRRVKLPTYPFERIRCWVDTNQSHKNPEPINPVIISEEDLIQEQLQIMSRQLELLRQS